MKRWTDKFLYPENLTLVLLTFKGYRTFLVSKHEGMSAQYFVGVIVGRRMLGRSSQGQGEWSQIRSCGNSTS